MGLYYANQPTQVLIGTKSGTTRTVAATALATTYKAESGTNPTKSFETGGMSRIDLAILYTMGSGETANSIELAVEESPDGTNWYRLPADTTSGDTSTITEREFTYVGTTNAGDSEISIGLDISYKFMRVAVKESGVASNAGSVYVEVTKSGR